MSRERITALQKILKKRGLTHLLISDVTQARYISGFQSSYMFLLITARRNILFTDFRYQSAAEQFCRTSPFWHLGLIHKSDYSFLRPFLRKQSRVGIQSDAVTLDAYSRMKKQLKQARFYKVGEMVSRIPLVKMPQEISAMQQAAVIGDRAFCALLKKVAIGMTEREAARQLEDRCRFYGSEQPSFETIVLFGIHSALPHGRPSNRKLRRGDWILVDFGCTVKGFCSDMTRTVVMGKATKRQKKIYSIVAKAQRKAREAVQSGIRACAVDTCARSVIDNAGYGKAFGHGTGHGVGLLIHEKPRLNKNDRTVLKKNMVVTVEPGIYLNGFGGVRIEDMMVVQERGARSLTKSPRELIEI